jgi:hypothetical protein
MLRRNFLSFLATVPAIINLEGPKDTPVRDTRYVRRLQLVQPVSRIKLPAGSWALVDDNGKYEGIGFAPSILPFDWRPLAMRCWINEPGKIIKNYDRDSALFKDIMSHDEYFYGHPQYKFPEINLYGPEFQCEHKGEVIVYPCVNRTAKRLASTILQSMKREIPVRLEFEQIRNHSTTFVIPHIRWWSSQPFPW